MHGYRRTFQHPTFIFFERGIADRSSGHYSSLSAHKDGAAEIVAGNTSRFGAVAFEIQPLSKAEWIQREEEFEFHACKYTDADGSTRIGMMCCSSDSNEVYIERWGEAQYAEKLRQYDLCGIWGLSINKDIKPCSVYLRHCLLAARGRSRQCYDSFLDDTYLVDMKTTVRQYLEENPWVMDSLPGESMTFRKSLLSIEKN